MKPEPNNILARPLTGGGFKGLDKPIASGGDMDRIFRLLERMRFWQCPCCGELFPQVKVSHNYREKIFGICPTCFTDNEDSSDYYVMPPSDYDLLRIHRIIYREGNIYESFGPHGNRQGWQEPPLEFYLLSIINDHIGMDKIVELYRADGVRIVFDTSKARWNPDFGFVPISAKEFPPPEDKKAWTELKAHCFIFTGAEVES